MSLDEKLIAVVEKYPVLYDNTHKYYYEPMTKENAWDEIALTLNENADVLKKKWTSFRDCFRKCLVKRQRKSGAKSKSARSWKFEKEMSFLKPHLIHLKGRIKGRKENSEQHSDDPSMEEPEIEIDEGGDHGIFIVPIEDAPRSPLTPSFSSAVITGTKSLEPSEDVKSEPVVQTPLDVRRKVRVVSSSPDHLKSFFKAMEDTVRTFSPVLQAEVKSKISSLVSEFEMQHLTSLPLNNYNSNSTNFTHVECSPRVLSPSQSSRTDQANNFEQLIFNQLQRLLADFLDN